MARPQSNNLRPVLRSRAIQCIRVRHEVESAASVNGSNLFDRRVPMQNLEENPRFDAGHDLYGPVVQVIRPLKVNVCDRFLGLHGKGRGDQVDPNRRISVFTR